MSKSSIEWTGFTWNPVTGCDKVSAGCKHCYAEIMHRRLRGMFPEKYSKPFLGNVQLHEVVLYDPLKWKKDRLVFVNSMSDLFHKDVPFEFVDKVFAVMAVTQHTFQVLTKRPERLREYFSVNKNELVERWEHAATDLGITDKKEDPDAAACYIFNRCEKEWPLKNIWLGVSCENQEAADLRIPDLLNVPASVRFLSCEPLLGPLMLFGQTEKYSYNWLGFGSPNKKIDWVIVGGESGHKARPMHPDWVRSLGDQCARASVPFFFKQWGEYIDNQNMPRELVSGNYKQHVFGSGYFSTEVWKVGKRRAGNVLDGKQHLEFPKVKEVHHA